MELHRKIIKNVLTLSQSNTSYLFQDTLRTDCDNSENCLTNCCVSQVIAPVYFVVFVLMAQFVLVNVVVAVLMKHLEVGYTSVVFITNVTCTSLLTTYRRLKIPVQLKLHTMLTRCCKLCPCYYSLCMGMSAYRTFQCISFYIILTRYCNLCTLSL